MPYVNLEPATFRPDAEHAYIPVSLSAHAPTTVFVDVITKNGTSGNAAISGSNYVLTRETLIFRPGDPLTQTLEVPIKSMSDGQTFAVQFPTTPAGAKKGTALVDVTATSSGTPTPEQTSGFREARTFNPKNVRFSMDGNSLRATKDGGPDTFATKLSHGRTQDGNAETGLYVDSTFLGIEQPLYTSGSDIVLHSQQFAKPVDWGGKTWEHGATVLSGHRTTAAQIGNGQYEWTVKMPNRRGGWPALWLVNAGGWPPEIDVYEGFGYNNSFDFSKHLSHSLHGGANNNRTFATTSTYDAEAAYAIGDFDQAYHKYAVEIDDVYVTWFMDGAEVFQAVNPFRGTKWYPIMNIAVKDGDTYEGGSPDMYIRSFKVYTASGE